MLGKGNAICLLCLAIGITALCLHHGAEDRIYIASLLPAQRERLWVFEVIKEVIKEDWRVFRDLSP